MQSVDQHPFGRWFLVAQTLQLLNRASHVPQRVPYDQTYWYKCTYLLQDFLSCCEAFIMHDNNFCSFFFLVIISILYFIEADIWINHKRFIPRQRLAWIIGWKLGCLSLWCISCTNLPYHFRFKKIQHKSIFDWTNGGDITVTHFREWWLQSTSKSTPEKSVD